MWDAESGILGMLALKFGAKYSVGTDLDPCAIDATYENMEVNGITRDKYEVMIGNIIDDKEVQDKVGYGKYDIVVANILGRCAGGSNTGNRRSAKRRWNLYHQWDGPDYKKRQ